MFLVLREQEGALLRDQDWHKYLLVSFGVLFVVGRALSQMHTNSPVKLCMTLTHRHLFAKKEKMVSKTIDNLENGCSLTRKYLILAMTRKTRPLSYTQTCYKETGKLTMLRALLLPGE